MRFFAFLLLLGVVGGNPVGLVFGGNVVNQGRYLAFNGDGFADLTWHGAPMLPSFRCPVAMTLQSVSYSSQSGGPGTKFNFYIGGIPYSWPHPATSVGWVPFSPPLACAAGTTLDVRHDTVPLPGQTTLTLWFSVSGATTVQAITFSADYFIGASQPLWLNLNTHAACNSAGYCEPGDALAAPSGVPMPVPRLRVPLQYDATFLGAWASAPQPFTSIVYCSSAHWAHGNQASPTGPPIFTPSPTALCEAGSFVGVQITAILAAQDRVTSTIFASLALPPFLSTTGGFTASFGGTVPFTAGTMYLPYHAGSRRIGGPTRFVDRHVLTLPFPNTTPVFLTRLSIETNRLTGGGSHGTGWPASVVTVMAGNTPWVTVQPFSSGATYTVPNATAASSMEISVRWENVGNYAPGETFVVLGFRV